MKKIITPLLLSICCLSVAKAQINVYSVFFNKEGRFANINSKEFLKRPWHDEGKLKVKIAISSDDSLLRAHYRPYFEKHLHMINKLGETKIVNDLKTYYGFTDQEINAWKDESKYYIQKFPGELKKIYGYSNINFSPVDNCQACPVFDPYTVIVTGYPSNPKHNILVEESTSNGFADNWITYTLILKSEQGDINKVDYHVFFNKPEAQHFNKSIGMFPEEAKYRETRAKIEEANELIKQINNIKKPGEIIYAFSKEFTDYHHRLAFLDKEISDYFLFHKNIIRQWLWFTEGEPSLNPFAKPAEVNNSQKLTSQIEIFLQDSIRVSSNIKEKEKQYDYFKEVTQSQFISGKTLSKVDSLLVPQTLKIIGDLKTLQITSAQLNKKLDSLRQKLVTLKMDQAGQRSAIDNDFFKKNIFLYEGHAFPGKVIGKNKVYFRNYDRSNHLAPFQKLPDSYDESSSVYILIENETKKNRFLSEFKPLTDVSNFASVMGPPLDEINSLSPDLFTTILKAEPGDEEDPRDLEIKQILDKIKVLSARIAFFSEKIIPPPVFPKAFESDPSPRFKTDFHLAVFPDTSKSSYSLNTIVIQDKQRDTLKFRVNKLFHILPSVGLVFSSAKDPEILLNSDGSIKDVKYYNGFSLMFGLKFFPFGGGTSIYDPKFIFSTKRRPVLDYRKIHFIAGANVLSPLKQFYLGAGLDLWSGFSINGGWHLIAKKQEQLIRQSISTKSYLDYKNNYYLGVNVDVSVAIKLINILIR